MGWKGVVRSIGAAARAAERDAKRRQRQLELQSKQYAKMEALEQAAYEYDVYCNQIDLLKSVHKDCSEGIDWAATAKISEPSQPTYLRTREDSARAKITNYKPSLIDRTLKRESKIRQNLELELDQAIEDDKAQHSKDIGAWNDEIAQIRRNRSIAAKICEGLAEPRIDALKELNPFSEIAALGSSLEFRAKDKKPIAITIRVHGKNVLPKEKCSLLQSGKISRKSFPIGEFNELHQDYVCSCVLRVAREFFAILPDSIVIVTAADNILDRATGHLVSKPILSAAIPRDTLKMINMDKVDPSESMANFVHNMQFKKTAGFSSAEQLDENSFDLAHS